MRRLREVRDNVSFFFDRAWLSTVAYGRADEPFWVPRYYDSK